MSLLCQQYYPAGHNCKGVRVFNTQYQEYQEYEVEGSSFNTRQVRLALLTISHGSYRRRSIVSVRLMTTIVEIGYR